MVMYREIALVPPEDSGYRNWRARIVKKIVGKKQVDPLSTEYTRFLGKLEDAFRSVLSLHFNPTECRILRYAFWERRLQGYYHYRELDYVAVSESTPVLFFEMKFKERFSDSFSHAFRQLSKSLEIGRSEWPELHGVCINVFMGCVLGLVPEEPAELMSVSDLPAIAEQRSDGVVVGLWLSGNDLTNTCVNTGILLTEDIEALRGCREAMLDPHLLVRHAETEDFGSLGRYMRQSTKPND